MLFLLNDVSAAVTGEFEIKVFLVFCIFGTVCALQSIDVGIEKNGRYRSSIMSCDCLP